MGIISSHRREVVLEEERRDSDRIKGEMPVSFKGRFNG